MISDPIFPLILCFSVQLFPTCWPLSIIMKDESTLVN